MWETTRGFESLSLRQNAVLDREEKPQDLVFCGFYIERNFKMDCTDKQIGRNIKAIRNANKKSYLDFADAIGISDSLLEKIENGTRHATDEIIHLISKNTGFSFNQIKYKDLSFLEKGDLYLEDDLSVGDFIETSNFETYTIDIMKILFPIVDDKKSLENDEFGAGIRIAHEKIESCTFSSKDCITAINHFIRASKNKTCADLSAINILSCFGYLYSAVLFASASKSEMQSLLNKKCASFSDFLGGIQTSIIQSKMQNSKRAYLEKYNSYLTTYMRKLVETKDNSDYAYYFLCTRYWLGIMDEEITLINENQMGVFGESMLDSLWKMGNKYATALHEYINS